jgi:glycosyltransferase involved in cell wall biosynthesis
MKRVLIITYYWPPSGGAGVQRWLKFSKYLPKFGWQPVVFTPENVEAPVIDHSLLQDLPPEVEVVKNRIWEPYDLYKLFLGKKKEDKMQTGFISEGKQKPKIQENISIWIRGNFFIPDARKFWIKPSIKHLSKYLNENPVDAIVSTGPPHSTHLIALALKKQFNLPWIADFRDPWTNIDFYKDLKLSKWADKKHRSLEKKVLNTADQIICVSNTMKQEFQGIVSDAKIQVITNGYDESDYAKTTVKKQDKITFAHIGSISPNRNPFLFWEAMSLLVKKIGIETLQQKVMIQLIGNVDYSVKQTIINKGLETIVEYVSHVPHNEVTIFQQKAHYLILAINDSPNAKGVLTGKLFEYLASGTPIIGVGPLDGDAAVILHKTKSGIMFEDAQILLNYLENCLKDALITVERNKEEISEFSRENLTQRMSILLNEISL